MDVYRVLSGLIDNATNENLNAPDMDAMREVSEVVRSRADMPKEAIKLINNKLTKKEKKVTMLCLELLEYLSYSCEMTLFNQIATKEFMMRIGSLLKSHDSDGLVKQRVCCLIKCWKEIFHKDIQVLFFQFYDSVIQKGFEIPFDYVSPYASLKGSNGAYKSVSSQSSIGSSSTSASQNKTNNTSNGSKTDINNQFENIKQTIALINEMIDSQDPKDNVNQNSTLSDLIKVLTTSQANMECLIDKLINENNEQLTNLGFKLMEDIDSTFKRHTSLKRHRKPSPFKGKAEYVKSTQNESKNNENIAKAQDVRVLPPPQNFQSSNQQQPNKPVIPKIIDLLEDEATNSSIPTTQNPPAQKNDQFNLLDGLTVTDTTNFNQTSANTTQSPSNNNTMGQNSNVNKYAVFNNMETPNNGMNMGYNNIPNTGVYPNGGYGMGYGNMNNQMYGGYNNMTPKGMVYTMNSLNGMNNNNGVGLGISMNLGNGIGYGQNMNCGHSTPSNGYGTPSNGYGLNLNSEYIGSSFNNYLNVDFDSGFQNGFSVTQNKKKEEAFDDLDDMIGIKSNNNPPRLMQTTANKAPEFDLF